MYKTRKTAVNPIITAEKPNEKIIIHKGEFVLKNDTKSITVDGEIYFKWFPNINPKFIGTIQNENFSHDIFNEEKISLIINENKIGDCYISSQNIGANHNISGGFYNRVIFGDRALTAKQFKFSILNFDDYLGENIEYVSDKIKKYSSARISLINEKFEILIDKDINYKEKFNLLQENGGFQILYNGEINFFKNSVNFSQINEIMEILGFFLSFVSGKKNNPLFLSAIHEDEILYQDFTGYHNYAYEFRPTWSDTSTTNYFNDLFQHFYNLSKSSSDNKFFLTSIVHWYTEINCNSGYSEGSLIMAQTAIELLYNWLIIENKKIIIGKDSENLSASNKMRLLLSQLSISYDVPEKLKNLDKYRSNSKLPDAIESIVQIRNAIVHSQEEKRKKLSEINPLTIYEAVQLSLWYIEMSMLYILKFNHKYSNRCPKEVVKSYKLEALP